MPHGPSRVVALVVSQDGAAFLPVTLQAVVRQTRQVDDLLLVDTGSRDASVTIAQRMLGQSSVLAVRGPFGRAVTAALSHPRIASVDWLWLLHDDSAPDPGALRALLDEAALSSRAKILGPKLVGWQDAGTILEAGWSVDRTGRARPLVEAGELDQGQHDRACDVFSVSTAGMLVERAALLEAGGFDARMSAFGDDVDLCSRMHLLGGRVLVVPLARVRHFMAATVGTRRPKPVARPRFLRERHALATLMKTTGALRLPFVLALALGSMLVRAVALLATGRPGEAAQVVSAAAWNGTEVPETLRQRRVAQASRVVRDAELRSLRAPVTQRVAAGWHEWVASFLGGGGGGGGGGDASARDRDATPEHGRLGNLAARRLAAGGPALLGVLGLLVLAAVSLRGILGASRIAGGLTAPFPGGASDLWRAFGAAFSSAGLGSSAPPSPGLALHAMVATLTFGSGRAAQKLELLAALPLAAALCIRALRLLDVAPAARVVAGLLYAVSPLALAALAQGRLGVLAFLTLAPPAFAQIVLGLRAQQARERWRPALRLALLAAVATAFHHAALPVIAIAAVTACVVAVARAGPERAVIARGGAWLLGALVLAALLLFPWSVAGAPLGAFVGFPEPPAWRSGYLGLLALRPGGPGTPMLLLCLVYPALALIAVWPGGARPVRAAWLVSGLVVAAAVAAWQGSGARPGLGDWPPALLVPGAVAWAAAAALALERLRTGLRSFGARGAARAAPSGEGDSDDSRTQGRLGGWQRVVVTGVAAGVAVCGAGIALHMVRGHWAPLHAVGSRPLPATVSASTGGVLWLGGRTDGGVDYAITGPSGRTLLDRGVPATPGARAAVRRLVADLAGGRTNRGGSLLAMHGLRYVVVRQGPGAARLAAALTAQQDLVSLVSADAGLFAGRASPAPATVMPGSAARSPVELLGRPGGVPLGGRLDSPSGMVQGPATVALPFALDSRWTATLDGRRLQPVRVLGWAQGFEVPAGVAGRVVVGHTGQRQRDAALVIEAMLLLVVLSILARPSRSAAPPAPALVEDEARSGDSGAVAQATAESDPHTVGAHRRAGALPPPPDADPTDAVPATEAPAPARGEGRAPARLGPS